MRLLVVLCISINFFDKVVLAATPRSTASYTNRETHSPLKFLPEITDPEMRQKLECLRDNPWSEETIRLWYDRVLNPATPSRRVSMDDRVKLWPCFNLTDFLKFEVVIDGYTTTTTTTTTATPIPTTTITPPRTTISFKVTTNLKTTTTDRMIGTIAMKTKATKPNIKRTTPKTTRTPTTKIAVNAESTAGMWTLSSIFTDNTFEVIETIRQQIFECLGNEGWSEDRFRRWYNRVLNPITRVFKRVSLYDRDLVRDCMDADDFKSFGVMPDGYKFENVWQQIFECLKSRGWNEERCQRWYNRVLNPKTRVAEGVSLYDQELVQDCMDADDFKSFGVMPDGYKLTKIQPTETPTVDPFREQTLNCLKMEGWSEDQTRQWYDGVLNPKTRSGRVSLLDQDLVRDCVDIDDFLKLGLIPDQYTPPPPAPWQGYDNRPPQG